MFQSPRGRPGGLPLRTTHPRILIVVEAIVVEAAVVIVVVIVVAIIVVVAIAHVVVGGIMP